MENETPKQVQITTYLNGVMSKMTLSEIKAKGLNVSLSKSNGYSHWWQEVVPFREEHLRNINGCLTVWLTDKPIGFVKGSSETSDS